VDKEQVATGGKLVDKAGDPREERLVRVTILHVELAETEEDLGIGRIDLAKAAPFVDPETALAQTLIAGRLAPREPRGLHRPLEVGGPHGSEDRAIELRSDRDRLLATELGERRVAPAGDTPRGVVGGFTMTHQPEFNDLVLHGE